MEKTEDLADLMRINTHKLQMLSSLEEEKQKLISISKRVNKVRWFLVVISLKKVFV